MTGFPTAMVKEVREAYRDLILDPKAILQQGDTVCADLDRIQHELIHQYKIPNTDRNFIGTTDFVATMALWREHKQIFRFHPALVEQLQESEPIDTVPAKALLHLPYPAFYIEQTLRLDYPEDDTFCIISGAFISVGQIGTRKYMLLTMIYEGNRNGMACYRMELSEGTILEALKCNPMTDEEERKFARDAIKSILPLALYLCSENPDIRKTPKKNRPHTKDLAGGKVSEVGTKIAIQFRIQKHNSEPTQEKLQDPTTQRKNASPIPHMRKGHWHHFWVGKIGSDERRLQLRWVQPTFVNAQKQAEAPITVNRVDS